MIKTIGVRREDKNEWERRVPIIPADVRRLKEAHGIHTIVQPSPIRVFSDEEYRQAGAEVSEDLSAASVVLAVKEIPKDLLEENKVYVFFSHTIKGQPYNMDMLRRLIDRKNTLIDYERILDDQNRRLIFFGKYAGLAGMIETLHCLGRKLELQGLTTPFLKIKQPYLYPSLEAAKEAVAAVGAEIDENGLPPELPPLVVGFAGYGNVSQGAQEIFDLLPVKVISPLTLEEMYENFSGDNLNLYKVVFKEEDLVRPKSGVFELQDYYDHPDRYEGRFEDYLRYLKVLVNCIYWTEDYPRLVTKKYLKDNTLLSSNLNLKVIGDISCDIDGSIEITHKATMPDSPCFTYYAEQDAFEDGIGRSGVTVMAVDNLPCEFPRDASTDFSALLMDFIPNILDTDFSKPFEDLSLAPELKRALILQNGGFTRDYTYMTEFLS